MSYGYYGEGRQKHSTFAVETRWFNGKMYATGQKVIVRCPIFERSATGGRCWRGKRARVEGVITGFEANHRSRPCVKYTVPEGADAGEVRQGLMEYHEVSLSINS